MKLTIEDVRRLARLARLELSEVEAESYRAQLDEILNYVEQLDSVEVDGLEPTAQVTGLKSVTRPDEIVDLGTSRDSLLMNAPKTRDGYIEVQRVIE